MTDTPDEADFILFNTCAVRDMPRSCVRQHRRTRHLKKSGRTLLLQRGCIPAGEECREDQESHPQVNLLFSTHALWRFPSLLYRVLTEKNAYLTSRRGRYLPKVCRCCAGGREGVAFVHHVWLQQLLHLLHRAVAACGRQSTQPPTEEIEKELRELVDGIIWRLSLAERQTLRR